MSAKYERLVERRESLMDQFSKGEISRQFYLREMGAISLKADRKAKRMVPASESGGPPGTVNITTVNADSDSQDSLSETRPFGEDYPDSNSSDEEEPAAQESGIQSRPARSALPSRGKKKPAAKKRLLCPVCRKGFQLRRSPPLHVSCAVCQVLYHERCRKDLAQEFVCPKCASSPSIPAPVPSPSTVQDPAPSPFTAPPPPPPTVCAPTSTVLAASFSCCDEPLLSEQEVPPPPRPLVYTDYKDKFDERMSSLGFVRSPSQPDTIGDGNCGLYALLDQLNLPGSEPDPFFERDDSLFARSAEVNVA